MKMDVISKLTQKIDQLVESSRNQKIQRFWQHQEYTAKDHWRGIPHSSKDVNIIPFTVEPEIPMWANILNFSVKKFYTNPRCYLQNTLRMVIYRFEEFQDFTLVEKNIPIWLGAPFESSLFGSKPIFVEGESPWIDREPLIKRYQDLDRLESPDFHESGLMPLAHRMYHEIGELMGDEYTVVFPEWRMGPLGVGCALRGMQNLLLDVLLKPEFVHKLMRFITDARKKWVKERAKFLGQKVGKADLDDDEVNSPSLSPQQYEEFILPYEQEICQFHGGIGYWHSCGDTTKLLNSIRKISQIDMFHIGPWTDLEQSKEVFGKDTALEKCLMPTADVQLASQSKMEAKLNEIRGILDGTSYTVRADGLQVINSVEEDIMVIKKWTKLACRKLRIE
ncbi:hypothetical protein CEE35_01075 [Candidatus Aerophobetes bacterium Ae_b3b]|nr:MAG: hypothetical protein CEE35_01075 [Candidatus Aerophobetes bacterium Ae_b3b]